ncbi:hypothetical protein BN2497_2057 [Janthinobacterium sp. CG23_2]|nr:hypothetical protein BN2497_2057 [Janthinobacterium sp. CG23_2]CUU27426.1 hypothetical protein BN3177_2057 [Janthinobacterium sp. CG23_2]
MQTRVRCSNLFRSGEGIDTQNGVQRSFHVQRLRRKRR